MFVMLPWTLKQYADIQQTQELAFLLLLTFLITSLLDSTADSLMMINFTYWMFNLAEEFMGRETKS